MTTKNNKVNIEVIINIFKKYNLIINNNLFNNQFFFNITLSINLKKVNKNI
jgi:hypothetical protein